MLDSTLETLLWTHEELDDYSNCDCHYSLINTINLDISEFLTKADQRGISFDGYDLNQIARDFILTRNRHGSGFWDGDYPEPLATQLTELSHEYPSILVYIGDDDRLYGMEG